MDGSGSNKRKPRAAQVVGPKRKNAAARPGDRAQRRRMSYNPSFARTCDHIIRFPPIVIAKSASLLMNDPPGAIDPAAA